METISSNRAWPGWLPDMVRLYIDHTGQGLSIRALARREGVHASTVLRQVRRFEARREDPLVDAALGALGLWHAAGPGAGDADAPRKDDPSMTAPMRPANLVPDEPTVQREARRILRRLAEPGAILAIAPDLEKAAVLREMPDGTSARTATTDRAVAQAFALRDWIACRRPGRVAAYGLTGPGRAALRRMLAEDQAAPGGMAEAAAPFAAQHRNWGERVVVEPGEGPRRLRCVLAESPVAVLA
ncbi:MAG: helix-turn-helix domain-containing protein, partial [Gemmobacter sp.]